MVLFPASHRVLRGRLRVTSAPAFRRTLNFLCPFTQRQVVLRGQVRVGIYFRHQIPIFSEQRRREHSRAQVGAQALRNGRFVQVPLFQNLPVETRLAGHQLLEFHHQPGILVQDLQKLRCGSRRAIHIICNDVDGCLSRPSRRGLRLLRQQGCGCGEKHRNSSNHGPSGRTLLIHRAPPHGHALGRIPSIQPMCGYSALSELF